MTRSYPLANDPGMSNTNQSLVIGTHKQYFYTLMNTMRLFLTSYLMIQLKATVDLDAEINQNVKPRIDDEHITTHFVEIPKLLQVIEGTYLIRNFT